MKNKFNDLTYQELVERREQLRKEYMDFRINKVMGHVENPLQERNLRRQISRLNTIIQEFALGVRKPGEKIGS
ncbi:MAG: 50S ribosomal protein L29 [Spirochaetaceae bacterium]